MVVASEQLAGRMVNEVTTSGGEGIILRRPLSLYEHGRSNSLVKRKVVAASIAARTLDS